MVLIKKAVKRQKIDIAIAEGIKNIPAKNKILLKKLTLLTLYDILYFNSNIDY